MPIAFCLVRALQVLFVALVAAPWPLAQAHEPDPEEIALGSLADAELAFANMAWQRGVRAAFLAHFAPDGVVFEPAPTRLREAWSARPDPADPLAPRHDLGYTTGPFSAWNNAHPERKRHGVFFTVWQRNAQGRWEVVLDAGIGTPGIVDFATLGAAPRPQFRGHARTDTERAHVLALETAAGADGLTACDCTGMARRRSRRVRALHAKWPQRWHASSGRRSTHASPLAATSPSATAAIGRPIAQRRCTTATTCICGSARQAANGGWRTT